RGADRASFSVLAVLSAFLCVLSVHLCALCGSPSTALKSIRGELPEFADTHMTAVSAALRQFRVLRGCFCCSDECTRHDAPPLSPAATKNSASFAEMSGEERDDASPPHAA